MIKEENYQDLVEDLKRIKDDTVEEKNKYLKSKIAYKQALRRAQANFKPVKKSGYNARFGAGGKYATYEDISDAIYEALDKEGITFDHAEVVLDGILYLETEFSHDEGHNKYSYHIICKTSEINISMQQQVGGGNTYGRKYNLVSLSGMSRDGLGDDDAESLSAPKNGNGYISAPQYLEIKELLQQLPPHEEKNLLKWCQVNKLELIAKVKFEAVKGALSKKIEKGVEDENN